MIAEILIILFSFFIILPAAAQVKYEQEARIKANAVPPAAKAFVDQCFADASIKWYRETGFDAVSIEAKTKHNGKRYSIEFDTTGNLQDVELTIDRQQIPEKARTMIAATLDTAFVTWKMIKIQLQWTGSRQALQQLVREGASGLAFTSKYEIIVHGKKGNTKKRYEMLFDENGRLLRSAVIIPKNTDNLDF